MTERVVDDNSKKTNREKVLVLVAVIVLIGAGAVALLGIGIESIGSTECTSDNCHTARRIAQMIVAIIGLVPACAAVWAADKGDRNLFLRFTVATGAVWIVWLLFLWPLAVYVTK
jgi:hypothetical protein